MPATLSHLSSNKRTLVHEFEDGATVTIVYRPGNVTPRQFHHVQALQSLQMDELTLDEQSELMDEMTHMLADTLVSWDMLNDEGQPIAPTYEGLQDVNYEAQQIIYEWIVEDQQVGKANGTGPSQESSMPTSESRAPVPMTRTSRPSPTGTTSTKQRSG